MASTSPALLAALEVGYPPFLAFRYGLSSVAQNLSAEAHMLNGVEWESPWCDRAAVTLDPCVYNPNGQAATTTTTASFTQPAAAGTVSVAVLSTNGMRVGQ